MARALGWSSSATSNERARWSTSSTLPRVSMPRAAALATVGAELEAYSPELAGRPSVIAFNKIDIPKGADRGSRARVPSFPGSFRISAQRGDGWRELLLAAAELAGRVIRDAPGRRRRGCTACTAPGRGAWSTTDVVREDGGFGWSASSWSGWWVESTSRTTRRSLACSGKLRAAGVDAALRRRGVPRG